MKKVRQADRAQQNRRSLHMTGASCVGNTVMGLGKLVMGILSLSFFTCAGAFYTFGMVAAKSVALAGMAKGVRSKEQYRYYKTAGWMLIGASLLFMLYAARQFIHPTISHFSRDVALGIATFTFAELTLNIRGVIIERHSPLPLMHAIKMINLASSLICLVLTQSAILSFASDQAETHPKANGLLGVLMGAAATLLGIFMLWRIGRIEQGKAVRPAFKRLRKLMKREKLSLSLKPVRYTADREPPVLVVRLLSPGSGDEFQKLRQLAERDLHLALLEAGPVEF